MDKCVATVGTFDGLHLGHRAILQRVADLAAQNEARSLAITFSTHPLAAIAPARCPKWAVDRRLNIENLKNLVDDVHIIDFDSAFAAMTAAEFLSRLRHAHNVSTLVMGYDNTFGSDRLSSPDQYLPIARSLGMDISFVGPVITSDGRSVSSSRLRSDIACANLSDIQLISPLPLSYLAEVVPGRRLGRSIGFPTLNLDIPPDVVPLPPAVYAARVHIDGHSLPALLCISDTPTVGQKACNIWEIHIPALQLPPMYGRQVAFSVHDKIRDIIKFDSIEDLKKAIAVDIEKSAEILTRLAHNTTL